MLVTICDVCGKKIADRDSVIHAGSTFDRRTFHPACVPSLRRLLLKLGVKSIEETTKTNSVAKKK